MKSYKIWCEGYLVTGMKGIAAPVRYFGTAHGETFQDACITFFNEDKNKYIKALFNPDEMTVWGCRLFDNEADARKSFG